MIHPRPAPDADTLISAIQSQDIVVADAAMAEWRSAVESWRNDPEYAAARAVFPAGARFAADRVTWDIPDLICDGVSLGAATVTLSSLGGVALTSERLHPHATASGTFCLGSGGPVLAAMVRLKQWGYAVKRVHEHLSRFDPLGAYRPLRTVPCPACRCPCDRDDTSGANWAKLLPPCQCGTVRGCTTCLPGACPTCTIYCGACMRSRSRTEAACSCDLGMIRFVARRYIRKHPDGPAAVYLKLARSSKFPRRRAERFTLAKGSDNATVLAIYSEYVAALASVVPPGDDGDRLLGMDGNSGPVVSDPVERADTDMHSGNG